MIWVLYRRNLRIFRFIFGMEMMVVKTSARGLRKPPKLQIASLATL